MTMRWLESSKVKVGVGQLTAADILLAKATLAAWQSLEGITAGYTFPPGYGLQPADQSTTWGDRDGYALASFTSWWNNNGKAPPLPPPTTKNEIAWSGISYQHAEALKTWALQKGVTITPGGLPSPGWPGAPPSAPAGWPTNIPWPPPRPVWWPVGMPWPPVGPSWGVPPLTEPSWWTNAGLPWPPPVPGSSGYPYPYSWPPNLWPIPQGGAQFPPPIPPPPPLPVNPSAPRVPTPTPGGTPTCDPGFHYDATSKLCQPNLPGARTTPPASTTSSSSGGGGTGVLVVVGALIGLGILGAIFAGGSSTKKAA